MATTIFFTLLAIFVTSSFAMFQLETECPVVTQSATAACSDLCTSSDDCMPDQWCCANACGSQSCTNVMNSCSEDNVEYYHHDYMELSDGYPDDVCGFCWCQNGQKECLTYSCSGPMP